MRTAKEARGDRRRHRVQIALRGGSILLCAGLCSCMSVTHDMRKLEQPVTMNGNPFVCDPATRPSLKPVDGFSAIVSAAMTASSSPGPYQSQTTSESMGANEVQAKAFEKIGGDHSLTITDVRLDTESMGINLLLAMGSGVKISATGTVQKVDQPVTSKKEAQQ